MISYLLDTKYTQLQSIDLPSTEAFNGKIIRMQSLRKLLCIAKQFSCNYENCILRTCTLRNIACVNNLKDNCIHELNFMQ